MFDKRSYRDALHLGVPGSYQLFPGGAIGSAMVAFAERTASGTFRPTTVHLLNNEGRSTQSFAFGEANEQILSASPVGLGSGWWVASRRGGGPVQVQRLDDSGGTTPRATLPDLNRGGPAAITGVHLSPAWNAPDFVATSGREVFFGTILEDGTVAARRVFEGSAPVSAVVSWGGRSPQTLVTVREDAPNPVVHVLRLDCQGRLLERPVRVLEGQFSVRGTTVADGGLWIVASRDEGNERSSVFALHVALPR